MRATPRPRRLAAIVATLAMLVGVLPAGLTPALAADPIFRFPSTLVGSGTAGYSVASADFNGDGANDLAVGSIGAPAQIFLNRADGSGGFLAPRPLAGSPADATTFAIAAGDLNGDGAPDLALANNAQAAQVFINRNDGTGSFDPPAAVVPAGQNIIAVALGDIDGAGGLDLVLGSDGGVSRVLRNGGGGAFPSADFLFDSLFESIAGVAVADFDGQNGLDIALASFGGPSQLYLNDGTGDVDGPSGVDPLPSTTLADGPQAFSVAAGDLDGDALPDLVLGVFGDPSLALLNTPAAPGTFTTTPIADSDMNASGGAVADINGDGVSDLVLNTYGNPGTSVYLGRGGAGGFAAPIRISGAGNFSRGMALADLNGDGMADLALANDGTPAQIFLNALAGDQVSAVFLPPVSLTVSSRSTLSTRAGDLNADGWVDLVLVNDTFTNSSDPGLSQVLINDNGRLLPPADIAGSGQSSRDATLADLNGDGLLDLAFANSGKPAQLFLNRPAAPGSFAAPAELPDSTYNARSIAAGDLSGDGLPDLVVGYFDRPARVFLNSQASPGSFHAPVELAGSRSATLSIALGDLDGQNGLDILLGQYIPGTGGGSAAQISQIYFNQGGGAFGAATDLAGSNINTDAVAIGDLDGDGSLDIALAAYGQPSKIYLNDGGGGFGPGALLSGSGNNSTGMALGDLNGDGELDILLANFSGQLSQIFLNRGGGSFAPPQSLAGSGKSTTRATLADIDGDSALDLVLASTDQLSQLFLNAGVSGIGIPAPVAGSGKNSFMPAIADLDGDGKNDLLLANNGQPSQLFLGDGAGGLGAPADLALTGVYSTTAVAVGDLNADNRLDLALSNRGQSSLLYLNGPAGFGQPAELPDSNNGAQGLALGDLDGDGDLDLVLANNGTGPADQRVLRPSRVYMNNGAGGFGAPLLLRGSGDRSTAVAIGDLNGDSALDIVLAGFERPTLAYINDGGGGFGDPAPLAGGGRASQDVALSDLNGDGAIDVVLGNFKQPGQVFVNRGDGSGALAAPADIAGSGNATNRIALGDLNGDGVADLVLTSFFLQASQVYLGRGDGTFGAPSDIPGSGGGALGVALGDLNGDGAPDMALANGGGISAGAGQLSLVYLNHIGGGVSLPDNPPTVRVSRPGATPEAGLFSTPIIHEGEVIAIPYTLSDPEGDRVRRVRGFFSLDGGANWREARPSAATDTTDLDAPPAGQSHTFGWDTFTSGFFGQSDNLVFRLLADPGDGPRAGRAADYTRRGSVSATSVLFRARGTQVRVVEAGSPVQGAVVYRLSGGGQPIAITPGAPSYTTNAQGYLRGRGTINDGEELVALARIATTDVYSDSYDLYHTNIVPTATGVSGFTVSGAGTQTIEVSGARPLALFNLQVSLEWDARSDQRFLTQLRYNLQRASEFLFDATNGQAALGYVDIFHNKENWNYAQVRVYASNRVRPNAVLGGVVGQPYTVSLNVGGQSNTLTYGPGQVKMGAVWNRFGNPSSSNLAEDWSRTLAHELSHYLLFLDDNYMGTDAAGNIRAVDTCGGLMGDTYASVELRTAADWLPGCENTFSNRSMGRPDWSTLTSFYPALKAPSAPFGSPSLVGPTSMPLRLTEIYEIPPISSTLPLEVPIFYTVDAAGNRYLPSGRATAYLFQDGYSTPEGPVPPRLVNLGQATLDQILARGARPGDRLCLFEPSDQGLGCEVISAGDERLTVTPKANWRPDLLITPVNSRTLDIELRTLNTNGQPQQYGVQSATARLYPTDNLITVPPITLALQGGGVYRGRLSLAEPVFEGYVHVTASPDTSLQAVSSYSLGGNPGQVRIGGGQVRIGGGQVRIGGGQVRIGGGQVRIGGGQVRIGGGQVRIGGAPVSTAEGDVLLLADDVTFPVGALVTLQSVSVLPAPPPWATVIGQGHRLAASSNVPDLRGTAISFGYRGSDVPAGEEGEIRVYFRGPSDSAWRQLATTLNDYHNLASAANQGPGLYALMSSVRLPLRGPGWNLFGYPVRATRPIAEALRSVDGRYDAVYTYAPGAAGGPWRRYFPGGPAFVNNLASLEFGKGYWLRANASIDLLLKGEGGAAVQQQAPALPAPPATYYGAVRARAGFTPAAGQAVEVFVGSLRCGVGGTLASGNTIVYVVDVSADGGAETTGCGAPGRAVSFRVGGRLMATAATWRDSGPQPLNLAAADTSTRVRVFMPLVRR